MVGMILLWLLFVATWLVWRVRKSTEHNHTPSAGDFRVPQQWQQNTAPESPEAQLNRQLEQTKKSIQSLNERMGFPKQLSDKQAAAAWLFMASMLLVDFLLENHAEHWTGKAALLYLILVVLPVAAWLAYRLLKGVYLLAKRH